MRKGEIMVKIVKYSKKEILFKGVEFVRNNGIENLNARDLAKYIGCSTQPIFKNWKTLEEYKQDLKIELKKDYHKFISKYVDESDYLYTISYAYAMYAKKESNIFKALFITTLAGSRTPKEVVHSSWNIPTIQAMTKQYKLSKEQAEELYRDVRFYTHGIACQLSVQSIILTEYELSIYIHNVIEKLRKR